jgi:transcriptional/translational regulatory protein YebC/TACO1
LCSGTIGEVGTSSHSFTLKGVIYVQLDETNSLTKDQALEAAIEAGAEDVIDGFDDYDRPAYQVTLMNKSLLKVIYCFTSVFFSYSFSVVLLPFNDHWFILWRS